MSLVTYLCQRAEHKHEIDQFYETARAFYEYFKDRHETAVFIGNVNVGKVNLDGLLIKEDAIIIVEFKSYEGKIVATQNGHWTCNNDIIEGGGSNKTVFQQLDINKRNLKDSIRDNNWFTQEQFWDIQSLVVFSRIDDLVNKLDRWNRGWINISDPKLIAQTLDIIKARPKKDYNNTIPCYISKADIFNFIRKLKLDEHFINTEFSNTSILPADLFHKDFPHNGKYRSSETMLAETEQELALQKAENQKLLEKITLEENKSKNKELQLKNVIAEQEKTKRLLEQQGNALKNLEEQINNSDLNRKTLTQETSAHLATNEESKTPLDVGQNNLKTNFASENEISPSVNTIDNTVKRIKRFGVARRVEKDFEVNDDKLDAHQINILDDSLEASLIVTGCAGSGKSVIALHKAKALARKYGRENVCLIVFTNSLLSYMQQGALYYDCYNLTQWQRSEIEKLNKDYDFIIVDEIQDFPKSIVESFIRHAKKAFFFFGDSSQSIYKDWLWKDAKGNIEKTMSVDEIAELTNMQPYRLYQNYRLPRTVAKITQDYVGVDVEPYSDKTYVSEESALPKFIRCNNDEEQYAKICALIKKEGLKNVGILVKDNEKVLSFHEFLLKENVDHSFKYNDKSDWSKGICTVSYPVKKPQILTFHSSKGLQFETVIIAFYKGCHSVREQNALYVAMTRTYKNLYVFYTENLELPLSNVPTRLYISQ